MQESISDVLLQIEYTNEEIRRCRGGGTGGRRRVALQQQLVRLTETLVERCCDESISELLGGEASWDGRWLFSSPCAARVANGLKLAKIAEAALAGDTLEQLESERLLCADQLVVDGLGGGLAVSRGALRLGARFYRVLVNAVLAVCFFYLPQRSRMALGYSSRAVDALASCCPDVSPEILLPCALQCGGQKMASRIVSIVSSHGSVLAACGKLGDALTYSQLAATLAKGLKEHVFTDKFAFEAFSAPAGGPAAHGTGEIVSPSLLALWTDRSVALLCSLALYNVASVLRHMRSRRPGESSIVARSDDVHSGDLAACERDTLAACAAYAAVDLPRDSPFMALIESRLFEAQLEVTASGDTADLGGKHRIHPVDLLRPLSRQHAAREAAPTSLVGRGGSLANAPPNTTLMFLRGAVGLLSQKRAMRRQASTGKHRVESAKAPRMQQIPMSHFSSWLHE
jgi:hypothetical protein